MSDTDDILALERRRCEAISRGDLDAVAAMLTDDYLHVHATGRVTDKQATLDNMAGRPRAAERGEMLVRLYGGDTAVITGDVVNRLAGPDGERVMPGIATQVLRKIDGDWKFVSYQTSRPAAGTRP